MGQEIWYVQNVYCISFCLEFLRHKMKHPLFDWNMATFLVPATIHIYI